MDFGFLHHMLLKQQHKKYNAREQKGGALWEVLLLKSQINSAKFQMFV